MSNPKEKKRIYEMVLYYCPHCGQPTLEDIVAIRYDDNWNCPNCKAEIKIA